MSEFPNSDIHDRLRAQQPFKRKPCSRCLGNRGDYGCPICEGFGFTLHDRQEWNWRWLGIAVLLALLAAMMILHGCEAFESTECSDLRRDGPPPFHSGTGEPWKFHKDSDGRCYWESSRDLSKIKPLND